MQFNIIQTFPEGFFASELAEIEHIYKDQPNRPIGCANCLFRPANRNFLFGGFTQPTVLTVGNEGL